MAAKDPDFATVINQARFTAPAMFLYGSNADFVDSAVSELIAKIRTARPELAPVERTTGDAVSADPPLAADFFLERPLFGDLRFLTIGQISEKHLSVFSKLFSQSSPEPGPLMLLSAHTLTTRSKLLAAARDSGFCQMIRTYEAPLKRSDVADRMRELGVSRMAPEAIDEAYRRLVGEDPSARAQYYALLALYSEDGVLTADDLAACLPPSEDQLAGELLAAILAGNAAALVAWRRIGAQEGQDPAQQLGVLARALSDARRARIGGSGPPVFWKTEKTVKDAARRFPDFDARLDQAATAAHQLERAARSTEALLAERTERLLLRLSQLFG